MQQLSDDVRLQRVGHGHMHRSYMDVVVDSGDWREGTWDSVGARHAFCTHGYLCMHVASDARAQYETCPSAI